MRKRTHYLPGFLVKRCPKTGRIVRFRFDTIYAKLAFPAVGIAAIIWFLIRVIPKPSRAIYPCQQVAAGIGGTFLLYVLGMFTSLSICQRIRNSFNKKVALGFIASVAVLLTFTYTMAEPDKEAIKLVLTTPEGSNAPMGVARGIFPGRVAWMQDFNATSWDGVTGTCWNDSNTNQPEVDKMLSATLQGFTGTKNDKAAWDMLFKYNNLWQATV